MSVSRNTLGALVATVVVVALAAFAAGTAQAAPSTQQSASTDSTVGTLDVGFAVKKFVARGKQLYAVGDVTGTFESADGTTVTRKPFYHQGQQDLADRPRAAGLSRGQRGSATS